MKIKHITSVWRTALAALVILASLVAFSSVPVHAHCKGKHSPPNAHCDGDPGGGNSEIQVSTTIGNSTAWQADGAGPYVNDEKNVRNLFNDTGYFVLTMHKRQNRPGTRKVFWDLPTPVTLPSGPTITGTDDLDNHKTIIQVGKFTGVDLGALALGPGNAAHGVDMLLDLIVFNGNKKAGNDAVLVHYDPSGDHCDGMPTSGVSVERTDSGS